MTYIPTPGPLPGDQWKPSNATQGFSFINYWCGNCQRDKAMREGEPLDECDDHEKCEIIASSFRGEAIEWRRIDGDVKCIAFVEKGHPIPTPKCPFTGDLFA